MDKILTVNDVAEILKVKPITVREMFRENRLRAFKVGKAWRTTEQMLQEDIDCLARGEAPPPLPAAAIKSNQAPQEPKQAPREPKQAPQAKPVESVPPQEVHSPPAVSVESTPAEEEPTPPKPVPTPQKARKESDDDGDTPQGLLF